MTTIFDDIHWSCIIVFVMKSFDKVLVYWKIEIEYITKVFRQKVFVKNLREQQSVND